MPEVLVLGAGIAGISAVYHLRSAGINAEAFEAAERPGGTLDSFRIGDFTFDHAVHLSFSKDPYVRALFDRVPHHTYSPQPWCRENGRWLKHPVQSHLNGLSLVDRISVLTSYLTRPRRHSPSNYEEWLEAEYGKYFFDRFPGPYTRKYWTVAASELSTSWIGSRMRQGRLVEMLRGALLSGAPNVYYAGEMRYPKAGGYRGFIEPLLPGLPIHCGKRAISLDLGAGSVEFEDGDKHYFEHLVSTIPLPETIRLARNIPSHISNAATQLWASSVHLVSIGLNRPDAIPHLWSYLYDSDMLPARVYSPSMKAQSNAPTDCSSLQFETYSSPKRPCPMHPNALQEHCEELVQRLGFGSKEDTLFSHYKLLPYANVAYFRGMEDIRDGIRNYLYDHRVHLAGRYGEWEYFWSDQSLLSGRRAADKLIQLYGRTSPDWLALLSADAKELER